MSFLINPFAFLAAGGDFESIATATLGSDTATIEFTSIPSTYQHLQIRGILRTDYSNITTGSYLEVNGDTTGPYAAHRILGTGSAASAYGEANISLGMYPGLDAGNTNTANVFSGIVIDLLDYSSSSKNKTLRSFSGFDSNGQGWVAVYSGLWTSTSVITSLKFKFGGTAKFKQYSQLALYGIKA
jgi:hypothetical protein